MLLFTFSPALLPLHVQTSFEQVGGFIWHNESAALRSSSGNPHPAFIAPSFDDHLSLPEGAEDLLITDRDVPDQTMINSVIHASL